MNDTRKLAAPLACITLMLAAGDARADWPMSRHDSKRTGLAQGKGDIVTPKVAWSKYLGGAIASQNLMAHDVDGDGKSDLIFFTGGVVSAKKADDTQLWATRVYGTGSLVAIDDFDGDGKANLVARTSFAIFVIDVQTGALRWAQPDGEMGQIAYVRVADLDGDKKPDLVITECGGCGASKDQTGFIYSFGAGFASPKRTVLQKFMGVTTSLTVGQVDPANPPQLLFNTTDSVLSLFDGKSGQKIADAPSIGANMAWSTACVAGDVDGLPGDEFVCVASESPEPDPMANNLRKVFALKFNPAKVALDLLWTYQVPADEALSNEFDEPLIDLDGDGKLETVVTGRQAGGAFNVHVLDAKTGLEQTKLAGQRSIGAAFLESTKQPDFITYAGTATSAWVYNGAAKAIIKRWTTDGLSPMGQPNWARMRVSAAGAVELVTVDPNGNGTAVELLLDKAYPNAEIDAFVTTAASLLEVGSLSYKTDVRPVAIWSVPSISAPGPQLAIAGTDGVLGLYDPQLAQAPGKVRFGGFYATGGWGHLGEAPVIGALGGSKAEAILAHDSRGRVLRLDATKATADTPPVEVWALDHLYAPIILPGKGVAAIAHDPQTDPPEFGVVSLDPTSGKVLWNAQLGAQPLSDLALGNFDGDAVADIAVQTQHPGDTQAWTRGLAGVSGKPLFNALAPAGSCGLQTSGFTVTDWNGDGIDDIVQVLGGARADSGKDGQLLASSVIQPCYYLATPLDVNGDGIDELVLHAGATPVLVLGHDMNTNLYTSGDDDRPYPYGAIARCPDRPVLAEGSWRYPARLKLTDMGGASLGTVKTMVLAGGKSWPDEAAAKAGGAGLGLLTAASIHPDLAGDGRPVAVVGSGDGWLYAVDACSGNLRFAKDFGFAVGEAVFGDSDGDGFDEILVSVADGNLYALKGDHTMGTGGAGGGTATSSSSGTGAGGSHASHQRYPLYGRAGCACGTPASSSGGDPGILALAAAAIAALRRRRDRARAR